VTGDAPSKPLVSIVVVNCNGADVLIPCLRSITAQPYRPMEVILVDNGSKDGSLEAARREFPDMRIVANPDNRGFAEANNQGAAVAAGEYVVLLNNDTEVEGGWIPAMMEMLREPGVALVTSRVVTDGVPEEFYTMNGTINYLGYNIMRVFEDLSRVFFAGGASLMFRREDARVPFPEEYFLYHEDVHLSWRMRLLGYDVRMAQGSVVHHRGSVTTRRQTSRLVTFYQERNRLLNALLFFEMKTLVLLIPFFLVDAAAKICLSLLAGRKSIAGILAGYWWCLMHAGWVAGARRPLQETRKVPDREIMRLMSADLAPGHGTLSMILNRCARAYAQFVGLSYHA
jgi:GT2 family glycosyltransferase